LIRFRTTALPTLPLTVIPTLLFPPSLDLRITIKLGEWTFWPVRDKLVNSGRFLRRADFGNLSLPGGGIHWLSMCGPVSAARSRSISCGLWHGAALKPCVRQEFPCGSEIRASFFVSHC
jgi:hypothetical protein